MKIRTGFVSNSSSSSFCILGVTTDEIEKQVTLVDENFDWYERCNDDLEFENWISEYESGGAVGIDPHKMDDSLTVAQNKENVAEKINKNFGTAFTKCDIGFITDGGYNG